MKEYKEQTRTIKEKVLHKHSCDICGSSMLDYGKGYDSTEVTIEARIGNYYPEGDFREYYGIDCCSKCFIEKVKPLIEKEFCVKFVEGDSDDW